MLLHIIIEIVLAIAVLFASQTFWQLRKRERFLKQVICDPLLLQSLISLETLASPPPHISFLASLPAQKNEVRYVLNIKCVSDADRTTQRRVLFAFAVPIIAIFIGSCFLGTLYLTINVVLFLSAAFAPISSSAQSNALDHIFTIAVILHKWRLDKPAECDKWIEDAWSLRPLYEAVKKAQ